MEQIFNIWPTIKDLSRDLGLEYTTVHSWKQRGSIPARYDLDIVRAAAKRGHELSFEDLAQARSGSNTQSAHQTERGAA